MSGSNENGRANTKLLPSLQSIFIVSLGHECYYFLIPDIFSMCEPCNQFLFDVIYFVVGNFLICRFECVQLEQYIWRVVRQHARSLAPPKLSQHTEIVNMFLRRRSLFDRLYLDDACHCHGHRQRICLVLRTWATSSALTVFSLFRQWW